MMAKLICRWFALCRREAVATEHHPILGEVPICRECAAKVARLEAATRRT